MPNAFASFLQEQRAGGSTKTLEAFANEMATSKAASYRAYANSALSPFYPGPYGGCSDN